MCCESPFHPAGLSPRVRGNLNADRVAARSRGSIPACAGEPTPSSPMRSPWKVYPRVCGGTWRSKFLPHW